MSSNTDHFPIIWFLPSILLVKFPRTYGGIPDKEISRTSEYLYQKNLRSDQRESGIGNYDPKDPSLSTDPAYASRANKQNISQYRKIVLKTIDGKNAVNYIRVYNVNKSSGESVVKPNSSNSSSTPLNAEALLGGLTYHMTKDF